MAKASLAKESQFLRRNLEHMAKASLAKESQFLKRGKVLLTKEERLAAKEAKENPRWNLLDVVVVQEILHMIQHRLQ